MHGYRKQRTFIPARQDAVSAYNPVVVSQERRYAIGTSDDAFKSTTIRRMSMRSSVFENRKLLTLLEVISSRAPVSGPLYARMLWVISSILLSVPSETDWLILVPWYDR
jgi:hypothetical protein